MSTINPDLFQKFKNARKFSLNRSDGDGNVTNLVEIREDNEQNVKLEEIIDLLVAVGYFRARIKGLSSFDKVVGGMTWCIESCNIDVDVDLLFQENSTIGQKIALTEKIVKILPKMKCPHLIEPHQIQGLDFIHIYPVIQWLVKRAMEFRSEHAHFVRSYALNQYKKQFSDKTEANVEQKQILSNINIVKDVYRTVRYYKRKNTPPTDIDSRVQITLLEYGDKFDQSQSIKQQSSELIENNLITINEIDVELNEDDKRDLLKHYNQLQFELGSDANERNVHAKIQKLEHKKVQLVDANKKLLEASEAIRDDLKEVRRHVGEMEKKQSELNAVLKELKTNENKLNANEKNTREIQEMLILYENLTEQDGQFREHCKKEKIRLENLISNAKHSKTKSPSKNNLKNSDLSQEIEKASEEVKAIRLKVAKKNRIVASLQRQLDDVPNRAELSQYQRRFLELYNQVAAKHKETKQYYTLYNTLEDTRVYMKKELSLLNSIIENYPDAMQTAVGKDEFLKQFQQIVESVRQSRGKIELKLIEERKRRDMYSQQLHNFIEIQRKYVNVVRQLSIECKRHEALLTASKDSKTCH